MFQGSLAHDINKKCRYTYTLDLNKLMHLLHAEKTTIIRKQYAWQGFMSFSILFPAGTSPADCNLPSENNKPMMSLSSQHSNKEFTSFCLRNGKPQHSKIS